MASLISELIRSRWAHGLALVVVVLSLVLPDGGLPGVNGKPLPLCQFKQVTHLPCPGCGLTRGFVRMAHLRVDEAVFYNPVSLLLFPFTVFLAALLGVRPERREQLAQAVDRHRVAWNVATGLVAALFLVNGVGRIAWLLSTHRPSPW